MPYITKEQREKFEADFSGNVAENAGELNFMFTTLITEFMKRKASNYQSINDVIGALEGAKMEFYRRVVVPYEEAKKSENGDVF